jgi:hypothetical protein
MTQYITTTSELFWDDVPAEPIPAMITYGDDDVNTGQAIFIHYQMPSREELEDYWTSGSYDLRIQFPWGRYDETLKELIAHHWQGVPMLWFGCSCCIDDLWELNKCSCGAPIGRHEEGCYQTFPRYSRERRTADLQYRFGWRAGEEGRYCPSRKSVAWKQGYRAGRGVRKYQRWGVWPE